MSRSGVARTPAIMDQYPNISYAKGDCLEPDSFKDILQDVDGCVHTVGTLVENKKNPKLTYKAMNRDTAINMARELDASTQSKKNFVLISSAKSPPFLPEYLTTK